MELLLTKKLENLKINTLIVTLSSPLKSDKIKLLNEKYSAMGQDLNSYLDGLLYADYLTYWDYVQVDTLLSLQHTRTSFPDEKIFILYHQITELYFNLCIHELQQIAEKIENGSLVILDKTLYSKLLEKYEAGNQTR